MNKTLSIANMIGFLGVVLVNALANILPINGLNTGEVSAKYTNLFVPAGFTFSIWGIIYLLLFVFSIYQVISAFRGGNGTINQKIGLMYIFSSILNMSWIYLWHHLQIGTSVFIMLCLLASLLIIYLRLGIGLAKETKAIKWFVHVPFSIYLGWISVATIANVSAYLVATDWNGWGLSTGTWAVIMILVAAVLNSIILLLKRDPIFALVGVWALFGIWANSFFNELITSDVTKVSGGCLLFLLSLIIVRLARKQHYFSLPLAKRL